LAQLFPSAGGENFAQAFVARELEGVETMLFAEDGSFGEAEGDEAGLLFVVGAERETAPAFAGETDEAAASGEQERDFFLGERGVGGAGDETDVEPIAGVAIGFDFESEGRLIRRADETGEFVGGFDHDVGGQRRDPVGEIIGEGVGDGALPARVGFALGHPLQAETEKRADGGLRGRAIVDDEGFAVGSFFRMRRGGKFAPAERRVAFEAEAGGGDGGELDAEQFLGIRFGEFAGGGPEQIEGEAEVRAEMFLAHGAVKFLGQARAGALEKIHRGGQRQQRARQRDRHGRARGVAGGGELHLVADRERAAMDRGALEIIRRGRAFEEDEMAGRGRAVGVGEHGFELRGVSGAGANGPDEGRRGEHEWFAGGTDEATAREWIGERGVKGGAELRGFWRWLGGAVLENRIAKREGEAQRGFVEEQRERTRITQPLAQGFGVEFFPKREGVHAGFPTPGAVDQAETQFVTARRRQRFGGGDDGQDGLQLLEVARPFAEGESFLAGGDASLRGGQVRERDEKFREREFAALESDGEKGPELERRGGRLVAFPPVVAPGLFIETVGEMAVRRGEEPADRVRVERAALEEERVNFGEPTEPVLLSALEGAANFLGDVGDEIFAGGGGGGVQRGFGGGFAQAVEQGQAGGVGVFAMDLDRARAEGSPAVGGVVIKAYRVEFGALNLGGSARADDAQGADAALALVGFTALLRFAGEGAKPGGEFVGEAGEGLIGSGMMAGSWQGVDP